MDWNAAIGKNREALKRVLAMLVAMAGMAGSGGTLPRRLHRAVLRLLRPAEAATRRLVIVAARGIIVPTARKPEAGSPRTRNLETAPTIPRNRLGIAALMPQACLPSTAPRRLALPLFDPLRPWSDGRRRPVAARSLPRISIPGVTERFQVPAPPAPGDPIDASRLHLRLQALGRALDDLPREARRFALWMARRDAAAAQIKQRLDAAGVHLDETFYGAGAQNRKRHRARRFPRLWPLKPGRPPGWRRKPTHEVHDILDATHGLAVLALERPDTS